MNPNATSGSNIGVSEKFTDKVANTVISFVSKGGLELMRKNSLGVPEKVEIDTSTPEGKNQAKIDIQKFVSTVVVSCKNLAKELKLDKNKRKDEDTQRFISYFSDIENNEETRVVEMRLT